MTEDIVEMVRASGRRIAEIRIVFWDDDEQCDLVVAYAARARPSAPEEDSEMALYPDEVLEKVKQLFKVAQA